MKQFIFLSVCFCLGTIKIQAQLSLRDEFFGANNNYQNMVISSASTKTKTVTMSSNKIKLFSTYSSAESVFLRFSAPHWIDLTDEVTISGTGISFVNFHRKGVENRLTPNEAAFCEVELRIAANTAAGTRTLKLRRPNAAFGKDEETVTLELINNIRIHSYISLPSTSKFPGPEVQTFSVLGNGLQNLTGLSSNNDTRFNSLLKSFTIVSRPSNEMINLSAIYNTSGSIKFNDFFQYFTKNSGYEIINLTNTPTTDFLIRVKASISGGGAGGGSGSGSGGAILVGAGGGSATPLKADLSVSFQNIFASTSTFHSNETGLYNLCAGLVNNGQTKNTVIPSLTVVVTKNGNANSSSTTLTFNRNTNTNFLNATTTFSVPALTPGESKPFTISRKESNVCATKTNTAPCTRCGSGTIVQWNDKGVSASVSTANGETNTVNNSVSIP